MTAHSDETIQPRLVGVVAASRYLGSSVWQVRQLIRERSIPFCRIGRRLLLDRADLDAFIAAQKVEAR
jgi:excisionase family DNA binding protein